jgi:hypothetical protein
MFAQAGLLVILFLVLFLFFITRELLFELSVPSYHEISSTCDI